MNLKLIYMEMMKGTDRSTGSTILDCGWKSRDDKFNLLQRILFFWNLLKRYVIVLGVWYPPNVTHYDPRSSFPYYNLTSLHRESLEKVINIQQQALCQRMSCRFFFTYLSSLVFLLLTSFSGVTVVFCVLLSPFAPLGSIDHSRTPSI